VVPLRFSPALFLILSFSRALPAAAASGITFVPVTLRARGKTTPLFFAYSAPRIHFTGLAYLFHLLCVERLRLWRSRLHTMPAYAPRLAARAHVAAAASPAHCCVWDTSTSGSDGRRKQDGYGGRLTHGSCTGGAYARVNKGVPDPHHPVLPVANTPASIQAVPATPTPHSPPHHLPPLPPPPPLPASSLLLHLCDSARCYVYTPPCTVPLVYIWVALASYITAITCGFAHIHCGDTSARIPGSHTTSGVLSFLNSLCSPLPCLLDSRAAVAFTRSYAHYPSPVHSPRCTWQVAVTCLPAAFVAACLPRSKKKEKERERKKEKERKKEQTLSFGHRFL